MTRSAAVLNAQTLTTNKTNVSTPTVGYSSASNTVQVATINIASQCCFHTGITPTPTNAFALSMDNKKDTKELVLWTWKTEHIIVMYQYKNNIQFLFLN